KSLSNDIESPTTVRLDPHIGGPYSGCDGEATILRGGDACRGFAAKRRVHGCHEWRPGGDAVLSIHALHTSESQSGMLQEHGCDAGTRHVARSPCFATQSG